MYNSCIIVHTNLLVYYHSFLHITSPSLCVMLQLYTYMYITLWSIKFNIVLIFSPLLVYSDRGVSYRDAVLLPHQTSQFGKTNCKRSKAKLPYRVLLKRPTVNGWDADKVFSFSTGECLVYIVFTIVWKCYTYTGIFALGIYVRYEDIHKDQQKSTNYFFFSVARLD